MPEILIRNLNKRSVPYYENQSSVLQAIHDEFIDWMHTCGAKGKCTSCKMRVLSGMENISEPSFNEEKFRRLKMLKMNERLACQSQISDNIVIEVCEENKLPHLQYSN